MPARLAVVGVTASDNDGNVPRNTIDGDTGTRWSARGNGQWIEWDLGSVQRLSQVRIAFYEGDSRINTFDIDVVDGTTSTRVLEGRTSSGATVGFETFDFPPVSGRFVRYTGHGSNIGPWNSLTEAELWSADGGGEHDDDIGTSGLVTYPKPAPLKTSTVYTVSARQPGQVAKSVFTEQFTKGRTIHVAGFSCAGEVEITVATLTQPLQLPRISPQSRQLDQHVTQVNDRTVKFTITKPQKLILFPTTTGGKELDPLYLFADPLEDLPITATHEFGPGVHDQGVTVGSDETVHIAGGAVINGKIAIMGGAQRVKIHGRGLLQISEEFEIDGCTSVKIEGITIRNLTGDPDPDDHHNGDWTTRIRRSTDVTVHGVKVFSFAETTDGIDPDGSTKVTISDCLLSTGDDCIAIKSTESTGEPTAMIRVLDSVLETYPGRGGVGGDGVKIGTETFEDIHDVRVERCDVVRCFGENDIGGHSAFSIVHKHGAKIFDVHYTDIHVEADIAHKDFEIISKANGSVSDVALTNINWAKPKLIKLSGNDISNVTFQNCTVGTGDHPKLLTSVHDDPLDVADDIAPTVTFLP